MTAKIKATMSPGEWGLLGMLSMLWGGSFFFVSIAVLELPAFTIVFFRVALAALVLLVFIYGSGKRMPGSRRVWGALFVMGLLNNLLPFSAFAWSQHTITGGLASILAAATPLFTVLVAHVFTQDEKLTANRLLGVVIGFGGVAVMIGPGVLVHGFGRHSLAELAVLGASLSYACASVYGRRFQRWGVAPLEVACGQVVTAAIMLVPLTFLVERPWTLALPGANTILAILGLALLSTTVAYVVFFRILASAGATNIALVTFLVPVSAIFLGVTFLGERLELKHVAGMGLIALGLAAIDGRPFRLVRTLVRAG